MYDIDLIETEYSMIFGERLIDRPALEAQLNECTCWDDIEEMFDKGEISLGEYHAICNAHYE